MTLVPAGDLVTRASETGHAIVAYNVVHLESVEAVVTAAARARRAVIMQISQNCVAYHGDLRPLAAAARAVAESSDAVVGLHLDHAGTDELVDQAVALGFRSIMYDAAHLDAAENTTRTRAVVTRCHDQGVWVEAELGEVGGKEGVHSNTARTDPGEAAAYVSETGVDALAVAIGTSHAMTTQGATIDFDLLARLKQSVPVPLVLHGSSGVSDMDLSRTVRTGITKVNIATRLGIVWTAAIREALDARPTITDSRSYLASARDAVSEEGSRLLERLDSLPADAAEDLRVRAT